MTPSEIGKPGVGNRSEEFGEQAAAQFLERASRQVLITRILVSQAFVVRGAARIRTGGGGFADLCLTTWLRRRSEPSYRQDRGRARRFSATTKDGREHRIARS